MPHNVLITGVSGYLGGELIAQLREAREGIPGSVYALVRTAEQAAAVEAYDLKPLTLDTSDDAMIEKGIVDNNITIVFWLVDAVNAGAQTAFIAALAKVKRATGLDVHFLHTSGAKIFSSHAGAPTDGPLEDTAADLYKVQKAQKTGVDMMQRAVATNNAIIEQAEAAGVRSYIFAPCIVYGRGRGFGNPISIQTVAVVKAAKALRRVYRVDHGRPTWPVSHVADTAGLYLVLLQTILAGRDPGHGRSGYFLAASGSVAWDDIYAAMATALAKRGVVDDAGVLMADGEALEKMGQALACPAEMVPVQLGGRHVCTFTAVHGGQIGWKPRFGPQHILEAADAEVDLILQHI